MTDSEKTRQQLERERDVIKQEKQEMADKIRALEEERDRFKIILESQRREAEEAEAEIAEIDPQQETTIER